MNDAHRMRDDGVGGNGAQIVRREAFQDFVREAAGRGEGELQCLGVGDAAAIQI